MRGLLFQNVQVSGTVERLKHDDMGGEKVHLYLNTPDTAEIVNTANVMAEPKKKENCGENMLKTENFETTWDFAPGAGTLSATHSRLY